MIKKLIIDNFMAHAHTEVELGPGVTILTGPNNTGKSAVVEALRCLATNPDRSPNPAMFIRHGAKEARVAVEMDDGTRVVWVRTKRYSMYELWAPGAEEPEEYHKLQRKVPEDIQNVLRLNQVDLEGKRDAVDIHFGNQREPVFLLNRPDSDAAAFFAASTESAHLLAMQDRLKMRVRDAKREGESLAGDLLRIENELDRLEDLPSIDLRLEEAREMEEGVARLEHDIPALEGVLTQGKSLESNLSARGRSAEVLSRTAPPPELVETGELSRLLTQVGETARRAAVSRGEATALNPLESPPKMEEVAPLFGLLDGLRTTGRRLSNVQARGRALENLAAAPEVADTAGLAELLDSYLALTYRSRRLGRWHEAVRDVAEPPVPEPVDGLRTLLESMGDLEIRLNDRETALNGLENDLRKVVDTITERVADLGRCPTCGQSMTAADFLDHGGSHDH